MIGRRITLFESHEARMADRLIAALFLSKWTKKIFQQVKEGAPFYG
jgi:hypothetical protein